MNCQNCGANVDGKRFCPHCGAPTAQAPVAQAPVQQPQGSPTKVLVFGILGLALSGGIVGLIFAIIGLVQGNRYIAQYGNISKQVSIGRKLSIAGIIVGIIFLILGIVTAVVVAANWQQIAQALRENAGGGYDITIHL